MHENRATITSIGRFLQLQAQNNADKSLKKLESFQKMTRRRKNDRALRKNDRAPKKTTGRRPSENPVLTLCNALTSTMCTVQREENQCSVTKEALQAWQKSRGSWNVSPICVQHMNTNYQDYQERLHTSIFPLSPPPPPPFTVVLFSLERGGKAIWMEGREGESRSGDLDNRAQMSQ